ncbi:MAG TPA: 2-amino-4-hydroxy-6-hydroxymethyldihydropteridine diphosphokinase [Acidimicrobiia bacterium]|nr:2-amino-4-hydroxy-6-hydroxymethyldihydropteridine diphosphokinase [Acidimicrobiia bacterium]
MSRAFVALGSNLGDRRAHLQRAVVALDTAPGMNIVAVSRVYETDPVGGPEQGPYLNAVIAVETELSPHEVLQLAHALERDAHRERVEHWGPRTLDVDLLLYDDARVDDDDLTIPHPRMWERGFVLAPLRDVAPDLVAAQATWEGVHVAPVALQLSWTPRRAQPR